MGRHLWYVAMRGGSPQLRLALDISRQPDYIKSAQSIS